MKSEGFTYEIYTDKEVRRKKISLPQEMLLWGDFDNFQLLNYDFRKVRVAVLKYFGEVVAGICFYEKSYLSLFKIASSPHTSQEVQFGHIYIKNQDSQRAREQILNKFAEMLRFVIKKYNYIYFLISLPPNVVDTRAFKQNWQVNPNYTYLLDVKKIFNMGLPEYVGKKVRNIIKMASKEIKIKPISAAEFYECYSATYKRRGLVPALPKVLFEKLHNMNNSVFLGAWINKKLAGGMVFVDYIDCSYYITSGTIEEFSKSNSSELLLYTQIEHLLHDDKVKYIDLFGANVEKVAYFKAAFEPEVKLYFSLTYVKYPWLLNIFHFIKKLTAKFK